MSIFNTRYARLNFSYDKEKVAEEILQHKFTDIPAIKQFLSLRPFDLVERSLYTALFRVLFLLGKGIASLMYREI